VKPLTENPSTTRSSCDILVNNTALEPEIAAENVRAEDIDFRRESEGDTLRQPAGRMRDGSAEAWVRRECGFTRRLCCTPEGIDRLPDQGCRGALDQLSCPPAGQGPAMGNLKAAVSGDFESRMSQAS